MRESIGHFSLYGDLEPEHITASLGLSPSCVTPKGTWYEGAEFASKVAEWELYCPEDLTMNEQVEFLLKVLWPVKNQLTPLAEKYTADFNISGEGVEVVELKTNMLQQLAQLKINLYCFFDGKVEHAN